MSETEMDDGQSGWTTADVLKLIGAIRSSVPEKEKTRGYRNGLSAVDWDEVAFPPFSPEDCQEKWTSIMAKMRKFRSLPELIVEAEHVISNPLRHKKIHPELPKCPSPPRTAYIRRNFSTFEKQHPGLTIAKIRKIADKKYDELPGEEKAEYEREHARRHKEYKRRMQDFCKKSKLPETRTTERKKRVPVNEDEGLPEQPPINGLTLFSKDCAKAARGSHGAGFWKVAGQRWKELSETERLKYNTRCTEMKEEYNAKLMEYLDRFDDTEKQRIIEKNGIRLPKKPLRRIFAGEPKMPSQSGFIYFASDQMIILKKKISNHQDCLAKAKKLWQKLPTKEKEHHKERIHANMKQYSEDLQKWFQTLTPEEQTEYLKQNPNKLKFLDASGRTVPSREEPLLCQPSDSEDEDIGDINNEEGDIWKSYEDEDEEDDNMFDMY